MVPPRVYHPFVCPQCRTEATGPPVPGGKVHCTACGTNWRPDPVPVLDSTE